MTKEQLAAENERLREEVAALRELLTVIAEGQPPMYKAGQHENYYLAGSDRMMWTAAAAKEAMKHAGTDRFAFTLHAMAGYLRREFAMPLRYEPEAAAPAPPVIADSERDCDARYPDPAQPYVCTLEYVCTLDPHPDPRHHEAYDHLGNLCAAWDDDGAEPDGCVCAHDPGVCDAHRPAAEPAPGPKAGAALLGQLRDRMGVGEPEGRDDGPVACGARPYPAGSEGDDGTECALPAGHDGEHDGDPAFGGAWCPATTGPDDELDRALYCDRPAGHPGSHHARVPGDTSEVAWSDETASVTA